MTPTFGSIYCGAGAPLLAAQWAGLDIKWAIEPRKYFNLKTHRYNFPSVPWSDQVASFFENKVDILWGSPPCGGFSSSGRNIKNEKNMSQTKFEEFEYTTFAKEVLSRKPKIFILENIKKVKEFLVFNSSHAGFILQHQITKEFIQMDDYYIEEHYIQPTECGVPQIRERLFVIGSLNHFMLKPPLYDDRENLSIGPILQRLEDERNTGKIIPNDKPPKHSEEKIEQMSRLREGEGFYTGMNNKRLVANKPAPVIMSSATKYIHPWLNRTLTNRESAAIMGYPDDFVFFGSENGVLDQIGKGIVPQVAEFILKQAKTFLEDSNGNRSY